LHLAVHEQAGDDDALAHVAGQLNPIRHVDDFDRARILFEEA
jgi:hypothetical protein